MSYTHVLSLSLFAICIFSSVHSAAKSIPPKIEQIMQQDKYKHAYWGLLVKDTETQEILFEKNANLLFVPGSTTKLFTVAALLNVYGDDYRFQTPVYAIGSIKEGILRGDLVLVGQGDLTFGGRQDIGSDHIAYTHLDHVYANDIPGAVLTKQNPLNAINALAKEVKDKGIIRIDGNVVVDDRLFKTVDMREMKISPLMINENLIDIVIQPTAVGSPVELTWRPMVAGYTVVNDCKTTAESGSLDIAITSDPLGRTIRVSGNVPENQKEVVRTFSIKDPRAFARDAFIQALREQGIVVNTKHSSPPPPKNSFTNMEPIAVWTSPPLSQYAKLILKVSHNLGANLVPFLLALKQGDNTYDAGMRDLGKFTMQDVKVSPDSFVFVDAPGGDSNRLTVDAEIKLLEYVKSLPKEQFKKFYHCLPILGVDGSLEGFAKGSPAVGKVRAKTGTGISYNFATGDYFLTAYALTGFIEGKNGHLLEYMVVVNNGNMVKLEDIYGIIEDECQISAEIYNQSK